MNKEMEKFINNLLEKRINLISWIGIFLSFIFLRSFIEQFLALSRPLTMLETIMEFSHNLYFFSLAILILWLILSFILKIKPQKLSYVLIFSMALVIAPSLIDILKTHGQIYWSFYLLSSPPDLWRQYISIFGHLPSGIVYFGTKIVFLLTVFLAAGMVWVLTKNFLKTLLTIIGGYSALFFMGAFPSFFYYVYILFSHSKKISAIHSFDIAGFFWTSENIFGVVFPSFQYTLAYKLNYIYFIFLIILLAIMFFLSDREKFLAVIKNIRLPQTIYHCGMFFIGMGLGFLQYRDNFHLNVFSVLSIIVLLGSICLSWMASVIVNDINDLKIDNVSNLDRPLPKKIFIPEEYFQLGVVFFLLAVLGGVTVGLSFAILIIVYQLLAWIYSAPPFRLKKFPAVATFISSLASLLILFIGYILMSDGQTIHTLSLRIVFLLIISYTLSLPIKDFKDIEGDKKDGIWTIPVILGEKKARLAVATGVFISYILSVFFLNEMRLFFWAVFFGSISFVIINKNEINPKKLPSWVLGIVSIYLFILIRIAFV